MKKQLCLIALLSAAVLGAGCTAPEFAPPSAVLPAPAVEMEPKPTNIQSGLQEISFQYGSSTQERILLYRIDPEQYQFSFEYASSAKSIADWQLALGAPALVANGGYFHEDYSPSGLLIMRGNRIGERQFDFDKSAVLELAPEFLIIDTKEESFDAQNVREALQSFPLLIKDGMPAVKTDSGLKARRTFFGVDRDGSVYVGVVPDSEMSLYELAQALARMGTAWSRVLNLDGGPSTGIAAGNGKIENSIFPVPSVIVVRKK